MLFIQLTFFLFLSLCFNSSLTFYHTDHLGSTKEITNLESTEIWKQGYLPYGGKYQNEVNPYEQITNTHQYTGKEVEGMVGEEGTYYYGARYYRPDLGRFMSTDPGPMDITNPQSFNRYSYVNNNPFSSVDPDGRVAVPLICDIASEGGNLASLIFGDLTDAFIVFGTLDPSNPNLVYAEALSETFEDFSFYSSFCSVRGVGKNVLKAGVKKVDDVGRAAKGVLNIADDAFVHVTTPEGEKNILSKGLNPNISGFVTKWKYVKNVANPSDFDTMLYSQKLWSRTVGKFDNGFTILQINAKPMFFSPRTNWVNGVPQYRFNTLIPSSQITKVR